MTLRPIADFVADFPDDQVDDGNEIVVFGGRGVSEAVAGMLRGLGYTVAAPAHSPPYGWRFDARLGAWRIWIQVSDLGECFVLATDDRTSLLTRLFGGRASIHSDLLTKLHRELTRDGRFHKIQWWDRYDSRGVAADEPVSPR